MTTEVDVHELGERDVSILTSPRRLADLESSGLLDDTDLGALDALVEVAHTALGPDVIVAISVVTADSQTIVSHSGAGSRTLPDGPTPLTSSMCSYVVTGGGPDVIEDASKDEHRALVVSDLDVVAYLGFPLHGPRGTVLGAVCAIGDRSRRWSAVEVQTLQSLTTAAEFVVGMLAMARRDMAGRTGSVPIDRQARIQHGLRTPLTSLRGLLDLLQDGHMGELSADQLATVKRCAVHTQTLCDEIEALD